MKKLSLMREPPCLPALYSFLLGSVTTGSLIIAILGRGPENFAPFAAYFGSLALFHFLEYYWQAKYHPMTTTSDAFLLNHSKEYLMAIMAGIIEYTCRRVLISSRIWIFFQIVGFALVVLGLHLRSLAMVTAASNFSHDIRDDLSNGHQLIRKGVYALCRHPSYLGFFCFAVGGQILMGNLLTASIFVLVLQKFFRERIVIEEASLQKQYPTEYQLYKKEVWSGIPFHSN